MDHCYTRPALTGFGLSSLLQPHVHQRHLSQYWTLSGSYRMHAIFSIYDTAAHHAAPSLSRLPWVQRRGKDRYPDFRRDSRSLALSDAVHKLAREVDRNAQVQVRDAVFFESAP